jgi:hypothetical protein
VTRLDRSEAGREILSSTERLSEGLAEQENQAFARIAAELRAAAGELEGRVRQTAAAGGRTQVWLSIDDVLPTIGAVGDALMPAVGDLLAVTRERTLVVVRRHMKACGESVPVRWAQLPSRGVAAAKAQAPALETEWYDKATADFRRAYLDSRAKMRDQAERWFGRDETVDQLVLRLTAENTVNLPGSEVRGAIWSMRGWMNIAARSASVALTNGLLLAAMGGWDEAAAGATG